MSEYTPTIWKSGDVITAVKMNKMEKGIADAFIEGLTPIITASANPVESGVILNPLINVPENMVMCMFEQWNYINPENNLYLRYDMKVPSEYKNRWVAKFIIANNVAIDDNFVLTEETKTGEQISHNLSDTSVYNYFSIRIGVGNMANNVMKVCRGEIELYDETGTEVIDRIYTTQIKIVKPESVVITETMLPNNKNAIVMGCYLVNPPRTVISRPIDKAVASYPLVYGASGTGDSYQTLYGLGNIINYEDISEDTLVYPVVVLDDGTAVYGNGVYIKKPVVEP